MSHSRRKPRYQKSHDDKYNKKKTARSLAYDDYLKNNKHKGKTPQHVVTSAEIDLIVEEIFGPQEYYGSLPEN